MGLVWLRGGTLLTRMIFFCDFLLCFDECLEVGFFRVAGAPDGYVADEMGVDVAVVLLFHGFE